MPCREIDGKDGLRGIALSHLGGADELALASQLLCKARNVPLIRQGPDFEPAVQRGHHEVDRAVVRHIAGWTS